MSFKSFLRTTGTMSLKAMSALWKGFCTLMAGFVWALGESLKHASAADDSDEDQPYGSDSADYYAGAAEHHFKDGWGS